MTPLEIQAGIAIIVAVLAGAFASLLGWAESEAQFDPRKMFVALVRGAIAGVTFTFAIIASKQSFMLLDYALIFCGAMGIDLAGAKASRIIRKNPQATTPSS